MHRHEQLHRRQGRDAFPDPKAIADAIADAFPNPFAKAAPEPQRTVVSVVYVTASPTFDGPIGGYRTLRAGETLPGSDDDNSEEQKPVKTTPAKTSAQVVTTKQPEPTKEATKQIVADTSSPPPAPKPKQTTFDTSAITGVPSEISKPTAALTSSAAIIAASGTPTRSNTFSKTAQNLQAEATQSSAPTEVGMSPGGKAGLAIGILLIIGAILALVLFVFKRRKQKQKEADADNEKAAMNFVAAGRPVSQRTNPNAPRLSLRPVTQFLPNLGEKRASRANALQSAAAVAPQQQRQQPSPENSRNNPFSDAKAIDSVNAQGASPVQVNGPSGEILVAAAATGVGAGLARGASKRGDKPRDFTTKGNFMPPTSPSGTEFSQSSETTGTSPGATTSGAAIAAAGGPPNSAVHRVQLDFKPSMEDELELRAGQLIRLLHEYDDGWALCIRLDRSQQGVVPRTCLSTRPVKPRPQQPGQSPRASPQGQRGPQGQGRPMSPAMNGQQRGSPNMSQGSRPSSPNDGRYSPAPGQQQRPMNPQGQQQRPMTPQGQGRPRSPSVAQGQQGRRQSPPGPSPMNPAPQPQPELSSSPPSLGRKPVPGQAL